MPPQQVSAKLGVTICRKLQVAWQLVSPPECRGNDAQSSVLLLNFSGQLGSLMSTAEEKRRFQEKWIDCSSTRYALCEMWAIAKNAMQGMDACPVDASLLSPLRIFLLLLSAVCIPSSEIIQWVWSNSVVCYVEQHRSISRLH